MWQRQASKSQQFAIKLNQGSVWPTWHCISSALHCEMLWCRHLACPQQRSLNNISLKILVHCGDVKELCSRIMYINRGVSWAAAWTGVCYIIRSAFPVSGSKPLIGCFESISVNMAEIMLPNLASKKSQSVKLVWYSRHTIMNHLVAVFALSQCNITLWDPVALSLASSL